MNSPKRNSLHLSLIVVSILSNSTRFPVRQFSIPLHCIQKQAITINSIYTHISQKHSSLYPHQSNFSAAHYQPGFLKPHISPQKHCTSSHALSIPCCQFPVTIHRRTCIYLPDTREQCLANDLFCTSYKTLYL